jgi:dTDP-4-amino-4,6-dideoxygalactose transaminase
VTARMASTASIGAAVRRKTIRGPADLAVNGAVPAFADPIHVGRPNLGDRGAFMERMAGVLDRAWFSNNGPLLQEFEAKVAEFLGVRHCLAMCNGTIALQLAIRALGLRGEVIVPSFTFIATAHALMMEGVTPIFADIDSATHNLDPAAVRAAVTDRTTGILAVHLWGRPAPVEALAEIAAERGLTLFFDAAHAFGCGHSGRMIGGFGACEILSFHATKFFNTFEGGAVVTDDDDLAERLCAFRNFGFAGLDDVRSIGTNAKMIEPAAAMGLVNLEAIDALIDRNRRNHEAYRRAFAGIDGINILAFDASERSNFQYVVAEVGPGLGAERDKVLAALRAENVLARKYFWPGCHKAAPYRDFDPGGGRRLPATERVAERVIVLPTGTSVGKAEIDLIADIVKAVCR